MPKQPISIKTVIIGFFIGLVCFVLFFLAGGGGVANATDFLEQVVREFFSKEIHFFLISIGFHSSLPTKVGRQ